jgi:hypothetical protein
MTLPSSKPDDDLPDEALWREVERLIEFWDDEPLYEKWHRGTAWR